MLTLANAIGQHGTVIFDTALCVHLPPLAVLSAESVVWATVPLPAFKAFVERVLATHYHRNTKAMAADVGMDVRSLRRTLSAAGTHPFKALRCLRLAAHARVDASMLLRLADHREDADLIEKLYGRRALSADEEALLAAWREFGDVLGPESQREILQFLRGAKRLQARLAGDTLPRRPKKR